MMEESAFQRLKSHQKHKYFTSLLRNSWKALLQNQFLQKELTLYNKRSELPPIEGDKEEVANRFYYHQELSGFGIQEHCFLEPIKKKDKPSNAPFLPIAIYLDNLRSSFNVGSIIRTNEALRIGFIHFSKKTPNINHPKVQKSAMGSTKYNPNVFSSDLCALPQPIIGLETAKNAIPIQNFCFPKTFTLAIGNEELGLSQRTLKKANALVCIELHGFKNSLNVATAFAIAAQTISLQANHSCKDFR